MPAVFTTASTVLCDVAAPKLHGGKVTKTSTAKLKVNDGNSVLLASSLGVVAKGECTTAPPPQGNTPCSKVSSVNPSCVALKLKVGGSGVLLHMIKGVTNGTPPGALAGTAGQTKLTAL